MMPCCSSDLRRSERIFVGIPDESSRNSENFVLPRKRSRMISKVHRSPMMSSVFAIGQCWP